MVEQCDNIGASFKSADGSRGEVFDISEHLKGMFREDDFRPAMAAVDWISYKGKPVLVRGCGKFPVPNWAYMVIAAKLAAAGAKVLYGEPAQPIEIL